MTSDISVTDQTITKNQYLLFMFGCLRIGFSHENTDLASRVHATYIQMVKNKTSNDIPATI